MWPKVSIARSRVQIKGQTNKKPRTYRNKARKDYLALAKQKRPTRNKRRQAIKKQLQYINRNLAHIEQLIELGASRLSRIFGAKCSNRYIKNYI